MKNITSRQLQPSESRTKEFGPEWADSFIFFYLFWASAITSKPDISLALTEDDKSGLL